MIRAVLLDLLGVVYDGDTQIAGAATAVERLRQAGLPLRFVSNTTRSPRARIIAQLAAMGIKVGDEELLTPARAAVEWLRRHGRQPHLLVHPDLVVEFSGLEGGSGRAVVVGDAGEAFNHASLNRAFRELAAGADFVALAVNRTFKDADGLPSLDTGAFVAALEFASGRSPVVLGKPSPDFFLSALAGLNCPAADAVMIGDDAESDVAGALSAGLGAALLVRTGKYRPNDETRFDPVPTAVVDDLGAAADWTLKARRIEAASGDAL
ncbi:TIGR01458 family HAD-type hydrolase [Mesorhizobium sp. M1C.F.Ca.ET.193.01.1.1]|nr:MULTISPECIES: TIGR01458 family HAD-type hydrolase [unclassified Mesorhizobium]TGS92597.1 TIGR01458 family HAD-type hydrolase [bacterium M00.F.Ca.ET.177.01.1.1]TGQ50311.1 TIGR01458 family HAD-type hydrolase [Mesorhizobium sp. M1C.F.Ca.ET.210.01.1.1]TGQ65243.1 TIGR01458 family HAD-type hydrolase [Mesorhizobium sp. M1C.F.Ca.ET.212.01.1.1]TGQ98969.1 TIGR01458 family HAD-type hydrolase [Mesorhizobium sp. M1C.F.Ca.ET.204.01.1.1]TGR19205.1 TIGR01458 family HAD-type hydrolase [Mesorhizobium sp. M1C